AERGASSARRARALPPPGQHGVAPPGGPDRGGAPAPLGIAARKPGRRQRERLSHRAGGRAAGRDGGQAVPRRGARGIRAPREEARRLREHRRDPQADRRGKVMADPAPAVKLYNAGAEHFRKAEYDQAVDCFRRSADADPQLYRAWAYMGMAYAQLGQLDPAI